MKLPRVWFTVRWLMVAVAAPLLLVPLAEYDAVAPWGTGLLLWLVQLPLGLLCLAAVLALLATPALLFSTKYRAGASLVLACAVVYVPAFAGGLHIGRGIRARAFERLAERSEPLVRAVDAHQRKYGKPPESLDQLVPKFLAAVPSTGMAAYPEYIYVTGTEARERFDDNPWALYVHTPSGGINFDMFLYLPRQNYPMHGYGGWLERLRDWAYVHE
jgi:hypothetical protein